MILDDLALKYGTDKASNLHNYTRWYEKLLPTAESNISLLEIGVSDGKSLRMWREYYPNAFIKGIDIDVKKCNPIEGVLLLEADQKNLSFGEYVKFDVIIDDGSHRWEDQISSFKALWPHINPGGVYVIEDLHTSYCMEFGEPGGLNTTEFLHLLMDDVNMYGVGGLGDHRNLLFYQEIKHYLNVYQKTVESMTFYPSICFIRKSNNAD